MKEPYRWNYDIKVKTSSGTYEYELPIENMDYIERIHPDHTEITAKRKVKRKEIRQEVEKRK